jgi:hypothetical protein
MVDILFDCANFYFFSSFAAGGGIHNFFLTAVVLFAYCYSGCPDQLVR